MLFVVDESVVSWRRACLRRLQDPKIYVQTILDIHKKYNLLVMTAFSNDSGFVESLDKVALYSIGFSSCAAACSSFQSR